METKKETPKRILAIHAHPDDLEISSGGTLIRLAARGHHITMVTLAPGDCGTAEMGPEEIAAVRRQEAARAAAVIGAEYFCAEFRDVAIFSDDPSRRRVVEVLRKTRPDLIITAPPVDYMCDHEATSELVRDAVFAAPIPNYDTRDPHPAAPLAAMPHLYFTDPNSGRDREFNVVIPDFLVDIKDVFEKKREALSQHESQRNWLRKHHGVDEYLMMMERGARERGALGGLELAEGFRRYKGHPYPETPLLEELLGDEVIVRLKRA
jgi:LmbE family N-acetylglucosaminyl deacetylase